MSFDELYQEIILDHSKRPRNKGTVEDANAEAEGHNPLCGDQVRVTLGVRGERIEKIAFDGCGCAISTASASIMTELVRGRTVEEAERLFASFHKVVAEGGEAQEDLGEAAALAGVQAFPSRIKCATLCWHALKAAMEGRQTATTEA